MRRAEMQSRHVVLVGAMGSGKTTIGRPLAAELDRPFLDNDRLLSATTGTTAAALEVRDGIAALHRAEEVVLLEALAAETPSVIAAAASTIESAVVRSALRERAWVVWLRADPATLAARLPGSDTRPLRRLDPEALVREQARQRDSMFAEVADLIVDTAGGLAAEVVEKVAVAYQEGCLPQYDP
jgi:shikimate kinase